MHQPGRRFSPFLHPSFVLSVLLAPRARSRFILPKPGKSFPPRTPSKWITNCYETFINIYIMYLVKVAEIGVPAELIERARDGQIKALMASTRSAILEFTVERRGDYEIWFEVYLLNRILFPSCNLLQLHAIFGSVFCY